MEQILIYADSLTWGIVPNTRNRLPFEHRWPGVFENALVRAGKGIRTIAAESSAHFFDAGKVTESSQVDGIHLDQPQHQILGNALAEFVLDKRLI
jgi:lysophospholipase L1-like esterase